MSDSVPSMSSSNGTTSAASSPSSENRETDSGLAVRFGRFVFKYRNGLAPAILLFLIVFTTPHRLFGSESWDAVLDVLGILVVATGQALRVLVIGLAYIKRGGRQKTITANRLVCEGVFAHSRNPLYLGNFLMLTGLVMVWNSPLAYVFLIVAGVAFLSIVRAEETFLRGRFGADFEDYCARVNRFVPNFRGFRQTLQQFKFDWFRVLRKEYGTTFAWVSIVIVMLPLQQLEWDGWPAARGAVIGACMAWCVVAAAWVSVRWLKKRRKLGADQADEPSLVA